MKALTLIQPWATAIIHHGKTLENRPWAPWSDLIGQRIAIHAGKKVDKEDLWGLQDELGDLDLGKLPTSAIIGTVQLVGFYKFDWAEHSILIEPSFRWTGLPGCEVPDIFDNRWLAEGTPFAWVLRDPQPLARPFACRGALSLWEAPAEVANG